MRICAQCGQMVAEGISTCPTCGIVVVAGRAFIDDYRILEVLHEGYSSILCKARREGEETPVLIRLYTPPSKVDSDLANRLRHELEKLSALPKTYFVHHLALRQSSDGLWYRISEWVDVIRWGSLLSTGRLKDLRDCMRLFAQIASILDGLHRIGHIIPHLNLNDILVYEDNAGLLKVKIDFKLSRFLNPKLERPGPMLARLLAMHPDIIHHRPLDHRSDIWSLGKCIVEVLDADPDAQDLQGSVDSLPVPQGIRTLIRLMLNDNPDLRPGSMAEVTAALLQVDKTESKTSADACDEICGRETQSLLRRMKQRLALLTAALIVMIVAGGILWYKLGFLDQDREEALMGYANRYAASVAFVVVEYWLQQGDRKVYQNRAEGTAFLADEKGGYLLTNRHVACPWLEDRRLMLAVEVLQQQPEPLRFDYRIYLWFDGQRAFRRLPGLIENEGMEDIYLVESAYSTHGKHRVWIAGAAPVPLKTWERVRSPLHDDYAVLGIDTVPSGRRALPFAESGASSEIPKLTPLIALGFPLGSRSQADAVNVSVTRGHVRRTFENMVQVDISLHAGNSGGPLVDSRGKVIGIATNVAMAWAEGPLPVATPLSDIGLVLPITRAAAFLEEIKAGKIKWNGEMDVGLELRLQTVLETARKREWEKARALAERELETSRTPALIMAAAMMRLCTGDYDAGRRLFEQVLSIDTEKNMARLMILLTDWLESSALNRTHKEHLLALDWRSPDEFLGHLTTILSGQIDARGALDGGYTAAERSWLHLLAGMIAVRNVQHGEAWELLEEAVLSADIDDWGLYLGLSQLDRLQSQRLARTADAVLHEECLKQFERFKSRFDQAVDEKESGRVKLAAIKSALQTSSDDVKTQRLHLQSLLEIDTNNSDILISQAYYAAMDDDWDAALAIARRYLAQPGRTNIGKLRLGLLEPEILHRQGFDDEARASLETFRRRISDPWYRGLSQSLVDPARQVEIITQAGQSPEYLLTCHTALGLWAEGSGHISTAVRHYKEALGSYLDPNIEYSFAISRVKRLRPKAD